MTAIDAMIQQPLGQAIGWALLQFVWQGTLIALLTAALLAALRRSGPDVRYVVSTIALALILTVPVVTVVQTLTATAPAWHDGGSQTVAFAVANSAAPAVAPTAPAMDAASPAAPQAGPPWSIGEWLPSLVTVWLFGVALLTLRLFSGWMWVQRLKSHGTRPACDALQASLHRLTRRLHIARAVRLFESTSVAVPTVIGWLKPVVLLPTSAVAGLAPDQLEAILAHELAHIRRHDYIVNLLQTVVETLLFYHPAVWWVSRRIRVEREHCCDDLAVSLCGDPVAYAAALAELEGLRSTSGALALAATGGSLLQRVRRVLGVPTHAGRAPAWLAAGVALLVLISMSAGVVARDSLTGEPQDPLAVPVLAAQPAQPASVASGFSRKEVAVEPTPPAPFRLQAEAMQPVQPAAIAADTPSAATAAVVASTPAVSSVAIAAATPIIAAAPAVASTPIVAATPAVASTSTVAATPAVAPMPVEALVAVVAQAARAQSSSSSTSRSSGESSGNWTWSDNGRKVEVNYRGELEFTDDDTDVKRMSPGGYLRIKDGGRFNTDNSIEFRADGSGGIERRFWVSGRERPFEPEGRKWLTDMLPRFIRQSGIGAPARVTRIMKSGGPTAVLAEISRIEGSFARRVYFTELFKQPGLSGATIQQALAQAGREIDSDFELATLLIASNRLVGDDSARKAYLDAARTIGSDFELHRVLTSIVKAGPMNPAIAASVLDVSTSIESDFELASLLGEFALSQPVDGPSIAPYFKALASVSSGFEHHRALTAFVRRTDLSSAARVGALESAATIDSDFELASFLVEYLKGGGIEGGLRAPFFRAVASIDSGFERGRVLQAVARRSDLSDESVLELLRSTGAMNGHFEKSQVLQAIASGHPLTREGRDAYIDAAEKLGDFEQGQALSALVKNERRK